MNKQTHFSIVIKLSLVYLICGFIWILFSDTILNYIVTDTDLLTKIQTFKGWFFVSISACLFYFSLKKLYTKLSQNSTEYKSMFNAIRDGVLFLDLKGEVKHVNKSFLNMFNTDYHDIIGKHFSSLAKFELNKEEINNINKQLDTKGYTDVFIKELLLNTGTELPVEYQAYKIFHKQQELICTLIRDISQSSKIMDELVIAKNKAEESDALKSAFLQNMSHEIRTPMNGIVGFVELLRNQELPFEKRINYIDTITKSCNQLLSVVNDVLDISKIETGQQAIKETEFNLNQFLNELFIGNKPIAEEKNLSLSVSIGKSDKESTIIADKQKLHQIYSHLLSNALKFTNIGAIRFGYKFADNVILFFVSDSGPGIPEQMKDSIFGRFTKGIVDLEKDYRGTGLGLAICKGNLNLMKGEIWVDSKVGEGSTFYFSIPLKSAFTQKKFAEQYQGKNVLVVEDEDVSYKYVKEVLSHQDITVERACNGQQAVDAIISGKQFDIIFMDIRMPIMNGYQAVNKIKALNPDIPIVAQTAFVQSENKYEALRAGCDDYVTKPLKQNDLLEMFHKYVPVYADELSASEPIS